MSMTKMAAICATSGSMKKHAMGGLGSMILQMGMFMVLPQILSKLFNPAAGTVQEQTVNNNQIMGQLAQQGLPTPSFSEPGIGGLYGDMQNRIYNGVANYSRNMQSAPQQTGQ
jgi:hypothetical protein